MGFGRKSSHVIGGSGAHGEELQITPLLDLFVALISFLIIGVVLTKINVAEVGLSKPVAQKSAQQNENTFDLTLQISESRATVLFKGKNVRQFDIASSQAAWLEDLRKVLVDYKKQFPQEMKIRIEPQNKVSVSTLMQVMDGARKLKAEDGEIVTKDEQGRPVKLQYLFPQVVIKGVYGV